MSHTVINVGLVSMSAFTVVVFGLMKKRNDDTWCHEKDVKVGCGSRLSNAHTYTHTEIHKHTKNTQIGKVRQVGGRSKKKYWRTCTSILRPSTTVPCNFSLALSASTLCSNVTNPKPCIQDGEKQEQHAHYFVLYFTLHRKWLMSIWAQWSFCIYLVLIQGLLVQLGL